MQPSVATTTPSSTEGGAGERLIELQRRFMGALTEPVYGESRSRTELPPRPGRVSPAFVKTANDLIAPSASMEPLERLEVYHRQYWYRLLDSIAEDFPGLRLLLGDEPFWRLMEAYIEAVPSKSFTLRHLGCALPDFIAENPSFADRPVHAEEIASLEVALFETEEAAERAPVEGADLQNTRVSLQPHVKLLALRTPADEICRRAGEERSRGLLQAPTSVPRRFAVIYREGGSARVERVPRAAFRILEAVEETGSIDAAMERVSHGPWRLRARDAARVRDWFSTWVGRGFFCSAEPLERRRFTRETPRGSGVSATKRLPRQTPTRHERSTT
jgi:hypothetical protein